MTVTLKRNPQTRAHPATIPNSALVPEALIEVLSDTYRLVLKSHTYHWNVTGPLFHSIHEMTQAQYTDMFAAADALAERVRALGKRVAISPAYLTAGHGGKDPDATLTAEEMVRDLLADHEDLAWHMRELVGIAETAVDPVTADLATGRAAFHEKAAWMLRAIAG